MFLSIGIPVVGLLVTTVAGDPLAVSDAEAGECRAESSSHCALSLLQRGSRRLVAADAPQLGSTSTTGAQKVYGHPSPSKEYPKYPGFELVLVEEFDEPIDVDNDFIWTWSDGTLLESEVRYVKEAIQFQNGVMRLEVGNISGANRQPCSMAEKRIIPARSMTGGEIRTKYNMFRYGRYEASIKAPSVQPGNTEIDGNYIATLFTFRDGKFLHWREMQFEILGGRSDMLHTNVMAAENTLSWNRQMEDKKIIYVGENLRTGFHTYAFEWLPDRLTWYFDGKVVREKLASDGGRIHIPELSAKIMMSLWVSDRESLFGGEALHNNRYPMYSEYDWFRFYKWTGDDHYPCAGLSPECLTSDDRYLSTNNPCDGIAQEGLLRGATPCKATCSIPNSSG